MRAALDINVLMKESYIFQGTYVATRLCDLIIIKAISWGNATVSSEERYTE